MDVKKAAFIKHVTIASVLCLGLTACSDDDDNNDQSTTLSNSAVDFSNCREIAGGITVAKTSMEAQVPEGITVNSLTDMGFVFEGSDDLAMMIVRSLSCEAIRVTDSAGNVSTDGNVALAHVGTPINVAGLPATTYANDGVNGADFNMYTLSYQTSSPAYFGAMERAGLQNAVLNDAIVNELIDLDPDQCSTASLLVNVPGDSEFAFSITGEVVEATAACNPGGADFIANWWSVNGASQVTALSNTVVNQTFTETAGPNVFVVTSPNTEMNSLIGANTTRFTGFSGSGYIPSGGLGNQDMVAESLSRM